MDFDLTEEQKAIQALCRDFAREEVAPRAEEMDRNEEFPYDLVRKMAELGLLGLPFPEKYGGSGADTVSYALAIMELARVDASTAITLAAHVSAGRLADLPLWNGRAEAALSDPAGPGQDALGFRADGAGRRKRRRGDPDSRRS